MPKILLILLTFFNLTAVYSVDLPVSRISDDSLLRTNLRDTWMINSVNRVLAQRPRIETLETGERVQISAREGRDEFMVIFARELIKGRVATDSAPAVERRATGQFPGWAQGSWMLTRNKNTGHPTLIRIYLRSDQNTHIQFRPFDIDKVYMDVVLYGAFIARSIPVAVPPVPQGITPTAYASFERLYTMQLNDILRLVQNKFPLRYFEADPAIYRDSRRFVSQVRSRLGGLRFADDGALDENGNYVFIETLQPQTSARPGLNCSGFVKWLIDGILRPVTGNRLTIEPLKQPFGQRGSSFTERWEESRDVFFGLDWIRNLAAVANNTLRSPGYSVLDEFEVRTDSFSLLSVMRNNAVEIESFPGFLNEAGYAVEGLHPLLYTLAIDDPFSFYLAAVNNEIGTPTSARGTPRLRQYYHVAALVPYFDEFGDFRIAVFESAEETSFGSFRARYPGQFINLVRIPITAGFDP
ncbi:MAG: hypothetical protein FWC21_03275 [Treponema sp.]|nr:hypothetical protein [Treponema sp.]